VLDAIYQRRHKPDPATYIGRGKVEGLARSSGTPVPTP
jgi:GTP-binding protein HflX